ncbi:MAG TPA: hypothetical protein VFX50_03350, partial [Gemmatimonadales bacterium]|nr:hypothetical protein [Gemmatimonadales bacterium]
ATGQARADAAQAEAIARAEARAATDLQVARQAIEKRAAHVPAKALAKAEAQLQSTARRVDAGAEAQGNAVVATRLATEFGMSTQALLAEKAALGASWGQLMIAHALDANATTDLTVEQLITMHADGMGWGRIAAGLGIELGSAVSSVNAEARVAQGLAKADGRVSAMRGEGARAGVRGGVTAGLGAAHGRTGVGAGLGIGIGR